MRKARNSYQQLFDLHENPLNYGLLARTNFSHTGANLLCGDVIRIDAYINKHQRISKVKWGGRGCFLSQAAASLLTEEIKGMTLQEVQAFSELRLFSLLGVPLNTYKLKCALLPLQVLQAGAFCGSGPPGWPECEAYAYHFSSCNVSVKGNLAS